MNKLIYLIGAGRSGTTALATFLGNSRDITTIGEMHQFFEHLEKGKSCSCGKEFLECKFWNPILEKLPKEFLENPKKFQEFTEQFEYHSSIPKYLFRKFRVDEVQKYLEINEAIFSGFQNRYILDSAKYIGRYLGLRKSKKLEVKAIYLVRDVRGVVDSFSKQVQSSRKPLSSIVYWLIINSIAEIIYRFSKEKILKIKYEDLIETPISEFEKIEKFLDLDLSEIKNRIEKSEPFEMPHIVGGNRIKSSKEIYFKSDIAWKNKMSRWKQVLYYFLAFPIMILNGFKL
ncbi:sulfotransferase family protein [Thiovulum sp. ES]|nr:sulfotransferase family protein [Thiovulum sp. ES]